MRLASIVAALRHDMDSGIAAVMFLESKVDLDRMDVRGGPCAAVGTDTAPVISPLEQDLGENARHTAALLTVLTGQPPDGALRLVRRARRSTLSLCSAEFVAAMAQANARMIALADEDDAAGRRDLPTFTAQVDAWASRWQELAGWPTRARPLSHNLTRLGWARLAQERREPLYVWHGPSVPLVRLRRSR